MPSTETQAEAWVSLPLAPTLQYSTVPPLLHLLPPPVNTRSNKKDGTCEHTDGTSREAAILFDDRRDSQFSVQSIEEGQNA